VQNKLTSIARQYIEKTPKSAALYQRARQLFPSGVTHDARYMEPHPVVIDRAQGSRKWDIDGNEYVDYFGGHGALLLGHNHPAIVEAVTRQLSKGTHLGASTELEVEWAELIKQLVPCAEKVRLTSSGTEASLLVMRVARAFSRKKMVIRLLSHFHGWQDQTNFGVHSHFDGALPAGIPAEIARNIILCPPNDADRLEQILESREDIAAVMLEPTGSSYGRFPTTPDYVAAVRRLTSEHDVLLIFDEVISGFRCAPGGAQECYGITPDLAMLAKAMAGGLPGGAVVGRADVMDTLTMRSDPIWNRDRRVTHYGTYNANPLSACAGIAALKIIAEGEATRKVNESAEELRQGLSQVIDEQGLNWLVYGRFSEFQIFPNSEDKEVTRADIYSGAVPFTVLTEGTTQSAVFEVRAGMCLGGVDLMSWPGGMLSAAHSSSDLDQTVQAFDKLVRMWKEQPPVTAQS